MKNVGIVLFSLVCFLGSTLYCQLPPTKVPKLTEKPAPKLPDNLRVIKPAVKPPVNAQLKTNASGVSGLKQKAVINLKFPNAWLKQGMDPAMVIQSDRVVSMFDGAPCLLIGSLDAPGIGGNGMDFRFGLGDRCIYGENPPGSGTAPATTFYALFLQNAKAAQTFRGIANVDGTISFEMGDTHLKLCVANGKVLLSNTLPDMASKFIAYAVGQCDRWTIELYHPGTKTFLHSSVNESQMFSNTVRNDNDVRRLPQWPVQLTADQTMITNGNWAGIRPQWRIISTGQQMHEIVDAKSFFGKDADADKDGHRAMDCGGDDCDDNDPNRFPGNPENARNFSGDPDCDCTTYFQVDKDGDGFFDARYFNICPDGTRHGGTDCDDNNVNIHPGVLIYVNDQEATNCDGAVYAPPAGQKFIEFPPGSRVAVLQQAH